MPSTTNFTWPYPSSSDLVKDGATAIGNLATSADTTVYARTKAAYGRWTAATGLVAGWTQIPTTTELLDTDGFGTAGGTSLTIPANMAGLYTCTMRINIAAAVTFAGEISIRWTTAAYGTLYDVGVISTNTTYPLGGASRTSFSSTQRLAVGDTVAFFARGGTAAGATEEIWIERVGM